MTISKINTALHDESHKENTIADRRKSGSTDMENFI